MANKPRKYVQARDYYLFGSGISSSQTTIKLKKMQLPNNFAPVTMAMFGDKGYATLDPEIPSREENISFTGITQNPDGTAELTGVIRGLPLIFDYTTPDVNLRQPHIGGSIIRITDSVPFFSEFSNKENDESINGLWDFPGDSPLRPRNRTVNTPILANELITKQDAINILSAPNVTPNVTTVTPATSGLTQVPLLSWNHTSSGTDRYLTVSVSTEETKTITSITFNGIALTQRTSSTNTTGNIRTEIWDLVNPPLGTFPVVVTMSAPAYVTGGAISYDNVDQAVPIDAIGTPTFGNSSAPASPIVTTFPNSLVLDILGTAVNPSTYTATPPQMIQWSIVSAATRQGANSLQPTGNTPGAFANQYTTGAVQRWSMATIAIHGVSTPIPGGSDEKVKVSVIDTTPGFLQQKLVAGANVILTPSGAGNQTLTISATGGGGGGGNYIIDQSPDNGTYGTIAGTINGVNKTFTVSQSAYVTGTLMVFVNGQALQQGVSDDWQELSPAGGTFDLTVAPVTGDIITVFYQTANTIAQPGIQWQDEGVNLGTPGSVDTVDFVGPNIVATKVGGKVTITESAQPGIQYQDEGNPLGTPGTVNEVDFTGTGVTASRLGNKITVNVPGGGGDVEKKVGVGSPNDITWFNAQSKFTGTEWTSAGSGGGSIALNSPYSATISNCAWRYINNTNGNLLPPSTKQHIFSCVAISDGFAVNAHKGGIGFNANNTAVITTTQGANGISMGFVRSTTGQWYARSGTASGFTETPITVTDNVPTRFRCEYDPANATPQARYYIDGVLVATITTNIPNIASGVKGGFAMGAGATTNTTFATEIWVPSFAVEI